MDLFAKCYAPSMADQYREKGIYPYFRALETRQGPEVVMEGKRRIMLGSNNYLGLTSCPEVVEAGIKALEEFGTGCSGSRFLNGTLTLHLELEDELARFLRKEAVMTFSTGFQSNLGIISALVGRSDYMILDRENHASIDDGTRLSFGKMLRYRHGDMADLERCLQQVPESAGALVITDGVFSMGGDIADLPSIVRLAKQYGARVMVDDAHGLGTIGEGGRGTASHFGLEREVDVYMGTFSKSFQNGAEIPGRGHPGKQDAHRAHLHLSGGADAAHRQGPVRERRLREHGPAPRRPGGRVHAADQPDGHPYRSIARRSCRRAAAGPGGRP